MTSGSSKTVTLSAATAGANCPSIAYTATVSATGDTNSGNNSAGPVTISVTCAPDVSISKSATTPSIGAGGTASYSVTVTAGGTGSSSNVRLTDVLPGLASMSWAVTGTGSSACSPNPVAGGSTLTCNFGTMPQGTTKTITLSAATSSANCPSIANSATVTADSDSNTSNNSAGPVTIAVVCAPGVSVSKSTTTPSINAGGTANYSVTVTAGGTGSSLNVKLTDVLPGPASMVWAVSGSTACSPNPVAGGSTLTCNFGTMPQGTAKTITLSAATSIANCPSIANTATVSATADSHTSNNSSRPVTVAVSCPDISVVKTTTTPVISNGGNASYTIKVTGNGPGSSSNVVLTDTLPRGLNWTVDGPDAGSCTPASPVAGGTTLTCSFGTVSAGATKTITLTGQTVLTWSFKGPNKVIGTSAGADFSTGGTTIHLDAFVSSTSTSNGTAAFVYGKDQGAGEQGVGICVVATGSPLTCQDSNSDHEINAASDGLSANNNGLIRIDLGANFAGLSNFVLQFDSVQSGFKIYTKSTSSFSGATLIRTGTSADDGVPISLANVKRYIVQASTGGDVLLHSLTADTCGTISNTATVTAAGDSSAGNNSSGPVPITISCVCGADTVLDFTGSSASSGTAGNTRTFTVNGLSVNATAFSRTNSTGAWATAYLGLYGPGLGITDGSEGSGANPLHKVDNQGGRNNYVLFEFSSPVVMDRLFLDSIGADSDLSVWIGTKSDPFTNHITLSDTVLTSLVLREENSTTSTASSRTADINSGGVSGNVLVVAASASDTTPDDEFKISQLVLKCQ